LNALKRVHLELGGKAPVAAFDDADWSRRHLSFAQPGTGIPECGAGCRVLVHESVAEAFVSIPSAKAESFVVG
jgi:aminobutyraldehyde dehydrogenase